MQFPLLLLCRAYHASAKHDGGNHERYFERISTGRHVVLLQGEGEPTMHPRSGQLPK